MDNFVKLYAVVGLLDDNSQKIFYTLWSKLEASGLKSRVKADGLPPHITFAIYEDLTDKKLLSWVNDFCKLEFQLPIHFNHVGVFNNQTVFLAPRVSTELLSFHKRYNSCFGKNYGELGWLYTPESEEWVPHATLMHNSPEENKAAIPIIMDEFEPFKAKIVSLAVYKFYPADRIAVFPLK